MSIPAAEPTNEIQRVTELLKSSVKPLSFSQLRKSSRLKDAELKAVLEAAIAQSAVFRWPESRRSQYFWSKSPNAAARDAVLAVASEEAVSRTSLIVRA